MSTKSRPVAARSSFSLLRTVYIACILVVVLALIGLNAWVVNSLRLQVREHQVALEQLVKYANDQIEGGSTIPAQLAKQEQEIQALQLQLTMMKDQAETGTGSSNP